MKKVLWLGVIALAGVSTWRWQRGGDHGDDKRLLTDRAWIDHLPRGERDPVQVFLALTHEGVGQFVQTSAWRGSFEGFRFETSGEELRLLYPQTGERERVRARAWRCDDHGMEYCLELGGSSRGVKRYYSREGWEIGSADDARRLESQLAHAAP